MDKNINNFKYFKDTVYKLILFITRDLKKLRLIKKCGL
jgi:hypothetical protein